MCSSLKWGLHMTSNFLFMLYQAGTIGIMLASQVSGPGSMPVPSNQIWLWDHCEQVTKDCRQQWIHPDFETLVAAESSQVRVRGYQWPHKMSFCPTKIKKKTFSFLGWFLAEPLSCSGYISCGKFIGFLIQNVTFDVTDNFSCHIITVSCVTLSSIFIVVISRWIEPFGFPYKEWSLKTKVSIS